MAKHPVPGQLLLTDAEFDRAASIVSHRAQSAGLRVSINYGDEVVRAQVAGINELRLGVAPDEIRRSEAGGVVRRGQADDGSLFWQYTYLTEVDAVPEGDPDWRTIHPSTWNDRVCESDFKEQP